MGGARGAFEGLRSYRAVEGLGAKPEEFMKMALDATRTLLLRAEAAIKAGDRPQKAKALASAGKIVEFMLGLSGAERGELSDCLASVYQHVLAMILQGNARDDGEALANGRGALEQLAAIWRKVFPDLVAP